MIASIRRSLGAAAAIAAGLLTLDSASAQWGYAPPSSHYGGTYGATAYGGAYQAPAYPHSAYYPDQPAYPGAHPAGSYGYAMAAPPVIPYASNHALHSPYSFYGYGPYSPRLRRKLIRRNRWSDYGEREIEYKIDRRGRVEIDYDD